MAVNDLLVEHFPKIVNLDFTAQMEGDLDSVAEGQEDWIGLLRRFYGPFEGELGPPKRNSRASNA